MRKLVAAGALALGIATLPLAAAHAGSTWIVTIKASSTTVNAGQKITFKGTVKPRGAAAGQKVVLQERFRPGAKWREQGKDKVSSTGKYSLSDKPSSNSLHSYRVVMPALGKHGKGVSRTIKVTVYKWVPLNELTSVNNDGMSFSPVAINGKSYSQSVRATWTGTSSVEINLSHKCDRLRSTFGVADYSTSNSQAEIGVLSDGTSVYDKTFDIGQSEDKTIDLATPLKIKLISTDTNPDSDIDGFGAFGDAQAHCTQ